MIDVTSLGVDLGGVSILEDVSLTVEEGSFVALVGPNGAGKTTLLRTLNGVLTPTAGTVTIDGHVVGNLPAREIARLVATVPQETTLAFDFDVREVVAMGRTPHRSRFQTSRPADCTAVDRALERTETAQFADRSIDTLSGGERQRVLLARALAQETSTLLLDEPTANLDINHQVRTLSLARDLADDGKTVVAAIHDLDLAARFCDVVVLLAEGRLVASGPPREVLTTDRLERAFGVRTAVTTNAVTGSRSVTPLVDTSSVDTTAHESAESHRVHVVGGGRRAARVVSALATAGLSVTAGILPDGDVAAETTRQVGGEVVTASPFEPVSSVTRSTARQVRDRAAVTVLAAPVAEPNWSLAADSDVLVGIEGVDPPQNAEVVSEDDVVRAVRERVRRQTASPT